MTLVFRIVTPEGAAPLPMALIEARQCDAFLAFLRTQSARLAVPLLGADERDGADGSASIEARVCPLPLAAITALFDHDPAVISVIEEAQFRSRLVCITREVESPRVVMRVSETADPGEHMVPGGLARALLRALGIAPANDEVNAGLVRESLADPALRARLDDDNLGLHAARLASLVSSALVEPEARLQWREAMPVDAARTLAAVSA